VIKIKNKYKYKYALIQYPKKQSISYKILNEYFKIMNFNCEYFDLSLSKDIFERYIAKILNKSEGLNITVPYKEKIIDYIDPDQDVKNIKACNLVYKNKGYNTDWIGFYETIKDFDFKDKNILILGAGGAAKAIIYALYKKGIKNIDLINRTYSNSCILKEDMKQFIDINTYKKEKINEIILKNNFLINCTSVGMYDQRFEFNYNLLSKYSFIYDIVYKDTELIKYANNKKINNKNGFDMWKNQAIENLKIWKIYDNKFEGVIKCLKT
jgi:shikimate dehydrogenase